MSIFPTLLANAVELDPVPIRCNTNSLLYLPVQLIVNWKFKVCDCAAPLADEMVVLRNVGVIPVEGAPEVYLTDQPLFYQYVEVSVYRTEAEIRKLTLEPVIYPARSRVRAGALQHLEDPFSLSASPVGLIHFLKSVFNNNRNYY